MLSRREKSTGERESVRGGSPRPAPARADLSPLLSSITTTRRGAALYALCLRGGITRSKVAECSIDNGRRGGSRGFSLAEKREDKREGREKDVPCRIALAVDHPSAILFANTRFSGRCESEKFMRSPAH